MGLVQLVNNMNDFFSKVWFEKYRPQTLRDLVLSNENRKIFESLTDSIPHLLFCSPPGQGKTTLAKILVKDILKCQYIYINASDENGIDNIRNKVITFAQTRSIDGKIKVVILDEADRLTTDAQEILRNVMEEYIDHTRFIFTCNIFNRIAEPLASRCQIFSLTADIIEYTKRLVWILKQESINIDKALPLLPEFFKKRYPDFRRALNDLQTLSLSGELVLDKANESIKDVAYHLYNELFFIRSDIFALRQFVIQSTQNFSNNFQQLYKEFFEVVFAGELNTEKKKLYLICISEYMFRDNSRLDPEINFFECLLQLDQIILIK